jgi:Hsp70 protein
MWIISDQLPGSRTRAQPHPNPFPTLPHPSPPHTSLRPSGVLHACEIADINCLKVANESTLIALSYGIFKSAKKLFSETEAAHTMFIDIGYTVCCDTIFDRTVFGCYASFCRHFLLTTLSHRNLFPPIFPPSPHATPSSHNPITLAP